MCLRHDADLGSTWRFLSTMEAQLTAELPRWLRSTKCEAGDCVEIAVIGQEICIRDSKDPGGPILRFSSVEWEAFRQGVVAGEFTFQGDS